MKFYKCNKCGNVVIKGIQGIAHFFRIGPCNGFASGQQGFARFVTELHMYFLPDDSNIKSADTESVSALLLLCSCAGNEEESSQMQSSQSADMSVVSEEESNHDGETKKVVSKLTIKNETGKISQYIQTFKRRGN